MRARMRRRTFFGKGQDFEKNLIAKVSGVSVDKALEMFRDKIQGRLEGGPAGLRRAFQFFDRNGSGGIDYEEFKQALKLYTSRGNLANQGTTNVRLLQHSIYDAKRFKLLNATSVDTVARRHGWRAAGALSYCSMHLFSSWRALFNHVSIYFRYV